MNQASQVASNGQSFAALDPAEGRLIVKVLATVLEKLVAANSQNEESHNVTKFHALRPPGICICDYLERIFKYASCSGECFVLALVYIDRLIQRKNFILTSLNVHRIIITSVMLAAKFFDDQYFNNAYYAKVGGVPCAEMNSLELEFLFLVNFSLHVTPQIYDKYQRELQNQRNLQNINGASAQIGAPPGFADQTAAESDGSTWAPGSAEQPPTGAASVVAPTATPAVPPPAPAALVAGEPQPVAGSGTGGLK